MWFIVPAVVAAASILAFVAFLQGYGEELDAAASSEAIGAGSGFAVDLTEGHRYYLFHAADEPMTGTPSCALQLPGGDERVVLDEAYQEDDWADDSSREWSVFGSFSAPETTSDVNFYCNGFAGDMLVRPDRSTFGWLVLAVVLLGGGLLLALALLVLLIVLRYRNARPPPPPPGWGYGPAPWAGHWTG